MQLINRESTEECSIVMAAICTHYKQNLLMCAIVCKQRKEVGFVEEVNKWSVFYYLGTKGL